MGLSGAGKSTLASALTANLRRQGLPVLELDGDILRHGLCQGLGFSDQDRMENLRRAAEVARLGADSGLHVVASFITPLESHRKAIQDIIGAARLSLIWADAPIAVCRLRDVKGLYAKAQAGQMPQMTGLGSAFERPKHPDLMLSTSTESPTESADRLSEFARIKLGHSR